MDRFTARRHLSEEQIDQNKKLHGFLAFAGELHNHPIDWRKRNAKVLGYLTLADSNFRMANNSSSLKIGKLVVLPGFEA